MTAVAPLARPARVLRLEIRRSAALWAVPLLLVLFYADSFRTGAGYPPVWSVRASVISNHMLLDFSGFAAGFGAWAGSREGRRKTGDLLATTVRAAWARQASALAGTLFWLVLTFLAGVAVVYVSTALQATWGGPPLWPIAVGVVGVVTAGVIGFTAGAVFPSRFTAPLVGIAVLMLNVVGFHAALALGNGSASGTDALLSPETAEPPVDLGVFYHVPPDVAIAQVMFMGGITVALLGVLTLAPVYRVSYPELRSAAGRAGQWLCAAGVALLLAGVAASWTAYSVTGAATDGVNGWQIPALHDAASDNPIPYTPDCTGTTFTVCIHPAFSAELSAVASLEPVAAEIAGLPGAPRSAEQVASNQAPGSDTAGTTSVYQFSGNNSLAPFLGSVPKTTSWRVAFQQEFLQWFVTGPQQAAQGFAGPGLGPAQQAVVTALMAGVGSTPSGLSTCGNCGWSPTQIAAAAGRLEALPAAARHAWLAAHLPALRAGTLTLAQIP
jgi:hypothetical protein